MLPMPGIVTSDIARDLDRTAAVANAGALVARGLLYAAAYVAADHYDCGRAILAGLLLGDAIGNLAAFWTWRHAWPDLLGQALLLGLCWLCLHDRVGWPDDPAQRAVLGLTAFGVGVARLGGSLLSRMSDPGDCA